MISVQTTDGLAVIVMDDGKANAFDATALAVATEALDAATNAASAIVLTGRAGVFSAGLDLNALRAAGPDEATQLLNGAQGLLKSLLAAPVPVVAAASGHAMALGALILLACDGRIGAQGAYRIGVNATANGLVLPAGMVALLTARLHPSMLRRILLRSEILDPERATDAGFLDATTPPDILLDDAAALARVMAGAPTEAFAAHKRALNAGLIEALGGQRGSGKP